MNTTPTFHHTHASVLFRAAAIQGHKAQFRARLIVLMHLAGHSGYRRHLVMIMRALAAMERSNDMSTDIISAYRAGNIRQLDRLLDAGPWDRQVRDFPVAKDEARIAPQYFCGKPTGKRTLLVLLAQQVVTAAPAGTHDGIRDGAGVSRVTVPPKRKEYALPADLLDALEMPR